MKLSERNQFGIKLFTQPINRFNTIRSTIEEYHKNLQARAMRNTCDSGHISDDVLKKLREEDLVVAKLFYLLSYEALVNAERQKNSNFDEKVNTIIADGLEKEMLSVKNKNFFLKPEVIQLAKKISLNNFNFQYLNNLKTQKSTYLIENDKFFRFYKSDTELIGGLFTRQTIDDVDFPEIWGDKMLAHQLEYGFLYNMFRIDLVNNTVDINNRLYHKIDDPETFKNEPQYKVLVQFIQLLLFVCLSDLEINILEPNSKVGKTKKDKVVNSTKSEIIVVGTKWNEITIRTEGFNVGGHFRLQPCGKNRSDVKLIWIDSYRKNGYVRGARRDEILRR